MKNIIKLVLLLSAILLSINTYSARRESKYFYTYVDRDHTTAENFKHIGGIYAASWFVYPLTQIHTFKNEGSFDRYKENFGKIVFDQDEPFWNWIVHPYTGSQLFLYYRANGYSRTHSLAMTMISSTLFEFTVEIYTEPASIQDLYQTPILGSVLGLGIETFSLYLLNTGNMFGRVFGHIINPSTLFWFYEGKMMLTPSYDLKGKVGLNFYMDF
ncbi:DUF3943 domain-containing protein [Halobacteriovorax sp. HLS]|uniref:DUF3943 domain-containing protein n=1 Tax=Halobacteriovorax sp. HLS TaxID=2234000 RepID=UPI0013E344C2|nr:DUF3943 domain-containing protein [Halobacteriovorax sp. HLS]